MNQKATEGTPAGPRPYEPPTLSELGDLATFTEGTGPAGTDTVAVSAPLK